MRQPQPPSGLLPLSWNVSWDQSIARMGVSLSSPPGAPLTPHPCRCCFLLLVPKDMTQFLAFEGKSFYFFPWALPREIGFSTKIPEHECCLLCARQSVLPLPQSLVFRCTVGMISPQALSQVGGIDSSCVSHGMWYWILGTVQRGQPLRTILPPEWTQVTLGTTTVSAKWVGSVENGVSALWAYSVTVCNRS